MPNFTLTPPLMTQGFASFNPSESVAPLIFMTPPLFTQAPGFFSPTVTLLPLYHMFPPLFTQLAYFYDPRVFEITEPDQILKNEVRRVT